MSKRVSLVAFLCCAAACLVAAGSVFFWPASMPGIASRPSDEQDKTARAVSSDGSLPVTMDRDLVSASSAIEQLDGLDAAQWEVVRQLRADGAKVGVLVCKAMEGIESYWRLRAMSAAPEIGVREGDDVWAYNST